MADFHQLLTIFFIECINIVLAYIYIYMGVNGKGVGVVPKAKSKKQDDTMVEFRVAVTSTCTHKSHYSTIVLR